MPVDFYFDRQKAGQFEVAPSSPGLYKYLPYRSGGHYFMGKKLDTGSTTRCTCQSDGQTISFTVVRAPEYGVLELSDFKATDA